MREDFARLIEIANRARRVTAITAASDAGASPKRRDAAINHRTLCPAQLSPNHAHWCIRPERRRSFFFRRIRTGRAVLVRRSLITEGVQHNFNSARNPQLVENPEEIIFY